MWTVPAERAKNARPHRVPLSAAALDVLTAAKRHPDSSGLVFPSANGREISNATMGKLLRENGIDAVLHRFRSSFRDWCGKTGVPCEVAEACLAHTVADVTEAAYARSDGQFHRSVHGSGHDDRCQDKHRPMEVPACQAYRWRCVSARRSSAL